MSVYYITGIQGGVGKSFVSLLTIDNFKDANPFIIDTDSDNPNVYKALRYKNDDGEWETKNNFDTCKIDTDNEEGWEKLLTTINENRSRPIIINSPARNKKAIVKYGEYFNSLIEEGIEVVSLFVVGNKQDSINHLRDYLEYTNTKICVIKNQGSNPDAKFDLFDNCSYAKNGIKSVELKNSSQSIQNEIFNNRKIISELINDGSFGFKIIVKNWLSKNGDVIKRAIESAEFYKGDK